MNKKLLIILLVNIPLFVIFYLAYAFTLFSAGYGAGGNDALEIWSLFMVFISIHLGVNLLLLRKFKIWNVLSIVLSTLELLLFYGIMVWYYTWHLAQVK